MDDFLRVFKTTKRFNIFSRVFFEILSAKMSKNLYDFISKEFLHLIFEICKREIKNKIFTF